MQFTDPLEITRTVSRVLDRLGIPWFLAGSLASSLHGIPRSTHDADIVANISQEDIAALRRALEPDFYVDEHMLRESLQHGSPCNIIHLRTMFKVDIFPFSEADEFSSEAVSRSQGYELFEDSSDVLFVASAEDVVLHKLFWFHLGGNVSERQWNDALGVLRVQNKMISVDYLQKWAARLGIQPLLEKALSEAGLD